MKNNKKLFGAAKIAHEKKATAERKVKASQASMKSVAKRKANMTEDELKTWRKKQSEASMKSYKARLAKMTAEQLAEFKAARNAKLKAKRLAKKADAAVATEVNVAVPELPKQQPSTVEVAPVINVIEA